MFLTFAPLSSNAGHLARFSFELRSLSILNEISIICLGKDPDNNETKNIYKNISFTHLPIKFDGWRIVNLLEVANTISNIVEKIHPGIVILMTEVWDLMRELSKSLRGKVRFITVVHAMPFLAAPLQPSGNFESDVIAYCQSDIEKYKKDYIVEHYKEVYTVFNDVLIIANNKTVEFYLKTYFPDLKISVLPQTLIVQTQPNIITRESFAYDFVYMARMESGKGIEYLSDILNKISLILQRKINIAILGRTDDSLTKKSLEKLLEDSKKTNFIEVTYFGWADKNMKKDILTKSSVFLYPSHYDNFPTVLNEALSFGLPVITWDVPFYKLNYKDTPAVRPVPLFDFQSFAEEAVKANINRKQLSEKAIDFVNSFGSPEEIALLDTQIFTRVH